jgi:hypothetical protein
MNNTEIRLIKTEKHYYLYENNRIYSIDAGTDKITKVSKYCNTDKWLKNIEKMAESRKTEVVNDCDLISRYQGFAMNYKEEKKIKGVVSEELAEAFVFPNLYKNCPSCKSENIGFLQNQLILNKMLYKIINGNVQANNFKAIQVPDLPCSNYYYCEDCDWVQRMPKKEG